jgi:purine-binding chemotaxis protein CheW
LIDKVGDVLSLHDEDFEAPPATLDRMWRDIATGIYRMENSLLIGLDIPKLLNTIDVRKEGGSAQA